MEEEETGTNIQKYGSYEMDAADAEHEELESSGGGSRWMKISEGNNKVRFLPPPAGRRTPFVKVWMHYVNLPGEEFPRTYNCPKMMSRKPCPLCAEAAKLKASGNKADRNKAFSLFPKRQVFAAVIDRADEESGPKIYKFGKMVFEQLVELRRDQDSGGDFTDPSDDGFDIVIARKGTGKRDTSYTVRPDRGSCPLGNESWITQQPDLREMAQVPTGEEIVADLNTPRDDSGSDDGDVTIDADAFSDA